MRYAIYFTPPSDLFLTRVASSWLGRDAVTGVSWPHPKVAGMTQNEVACLTVAPRRYGFHATLKAPFRLAEHFTADALSRMAERFCREVEPVIVPTARIERLGAFFAITSENRIEKLDALAARVVAVFDKFRAPLSEREFQRREPDSLSAAQLRNLQNWGYPSVFDEFRFHMTLTGPVDAADRGRVAAALEEHFAEALSAPLEIDRIAIYREPEEGAPFVLQEMFELAASKNRRIA
ncbi:DUF1045 domain-containing protein [Oricola cellulosilytica]|uniref:DUF1045 domain-containing protein n=1 Tax=Oricola cellulosilytica TaxID=1429082 RepID=A0A4R0PCI0_9HYPH|nr:DUF1045 domain-containing protein [Oricola cellulosilytica]TCD14986.1 DUF1045 domain-containing protein [Oricola cellulosilytica]